MADLEDYEKNGYCVVRGLVPHHAIDALLAEYRAAVLPSRERFFRQDRDNRWEPNEIDAHGHVLQSFLDVHDLAIPELRRFCRLTREIFCDPAVVSVVKTITGSPLNKLVLSMMFDKNVGTPPHQDGWGIDSSPPGRLIGSWFALEDIDERAGRFYVVRRSHTHSFDDIDRVCMNQSNATYRRYRDAHLDDVEAPALRKGDAVFWSSTLVHGALPTQDPRFSRKSLTAHYIPSHCKLGTMFAEDQEQPRYEREGDIELRRTRGRYRPVLAAAAAVGHQLHSRFPQVWKQVAPLRRAAWRLISPS